MSSGKGRKLSAPVGKWVRPISRSKVNDILYRAVDKEGKTIDFLLTTNRDKLAVKRFLLKEIDNNGAPEKITINGSAANKSALEEYNNENGPSIVIRQVKYLNNIVEQDHRG